MSVYISEQLKSMLKADVSYNTQTMYNVLLLTWLKSILHCINFFSSHHKNSPFLLAQTDKQLCRVMYENRGMLQHVFIRHTLMQPYFLCQRQGVLFQTHMQALIQKPNRILANYGI